MKKVYESHEVAYKNLKNKGAKSWHEMYATEKGKQVDHVGLDRKSFIEDVLNQDWTPKSGNVLEIGCGTGHLLRWVCEKGFNGTGIEISETALELAKNETKVKNVEYFNGDFCYSDYLKDKKYDLIIDGSCFHCIVEEKDRKIFLEKAMSLLKDDGVFLLLTMCTPIDRENFKLEMKTQKFINNIFYVPFNEELEGSKKFGDKLYMAQRKVEHWTKILKDLKKYNFNIMLNRFSRGKIFSSIYVACKKK